MTVTGAGGRTGKLLLQKLLAQPDKFEARGLVRDDKVIIEFQSIIYHNLITLSILCDIN